MSDDRVPDPTYSQSLQQFYTDELARFKSLPATLTRAANNLGLLLKQHTGLDVYIRAASPVKHKHAAYGHVEVNIERERASFLVIATIELPNAVQKLLAVEIPTTVHFGQEGTLIVDIDGVNFAYDDIVSIGLRVFDHMRNKVSERARIEARG